MYSMRIRKDVLMYTPEKVLATGLMSLTFAGAAPSMDISPAYGQQPVPPEYADYCKDQPGTHPGWVNNPQGQLVIDCLPDDPNNPPQDPYQDNQPDQVGLRAFYADPTRELHNRRRDRVDMGIDVKGYGKIKAIGTAVVLRVDRGTSNFWDNQGGRDVIYQLQEGPAAGKSVYVAENCIPTVHVHQRINLNTTVCVARDHFPFVEMGWAKGRLPNGKVSDEPVAASYYHEGERTAHGDNFNKFMIKLGARPSTINGRRIVGHVARSYKLIVQS
jgi:hypothetical protein